jgi:hypothetical protein
MLALDILKELERRGASVAVDDDKVIITPSSALDDFLRQEIRRAKPEIIQAIRRKPASALKACSWLVTFLNSDMSVVYIPAVDLARVRTDHPSMTQATVAQSCGQCVWHVRLGLAERGYCSSPDRHDQPGPYGAGHPARFLDGHDGAACGCFEVSHPSNN